MKKNENIKLMLALISLIVGMSLLAYASVPLYNLFCKVTGYGGTTRHSTLGSTYKGKRALNVTFDANIDSNLQWKFFPEQKDVNLVTGENVLIYYYAENQTSEPVIGTAIYNITPHKAGKYFNKIQCFCFSEQLLMPNQKVHMPVSFFIDPAFDNDKEMDDVRSITLSYSFFKVEKEK